MLCAFGHRVVMCCDMLGVVGSSLKMVKFELTTPNTSQHVATRWPNAHNMLGPTMLRYVVWPGFMHLRNAHVIKNIIVLYLIKVFFDEDTIQLLFRLEIKKNWWGGVEGRIKNMSLLSRYDRYYSLSLSSR